LKFASHVAKTIILGSGMHFKFGKLRILSPYYWGFGEREREREREGRLNGISH